MGLSKSKESYDINTLEGKIQSENIYGRIRDSGRNQYSEFRKTGENKSDADILDIIRLPKKQEVANIKRKSDVSLKNNGQTVEFRIENLDNSSSNTEAKPGTSVKEVIKEFERRSRSNSLFSDKTTTNGQKSVQNGGKHEEINTSKEDTCKKEQDFEEECIYSVPHQEYSDKKQNLIDDFTLSLFQIEKTRTEFIGEMLQPRQQTGEETNTVIETEEVDSIINEMQFIGNSDAHEEENKEEFERKNVNQNPQFKTETNNNSNCSVTTENNALQNPPDLVPNNTNHAIVKEETDAAQNDSAKKKPCETNEGNHSAIRTIREIKYDVDKLKETVDIFEGRKDDVQYVYLNEMLLRCLLKLDNVNVGGDEEVRQQRKQVADYTQQCMKDLDSKAEGDEADIEVAF